MSKHSVDYRKTSAKIRTDAGFATFIGITPSASKEAISRASTHPQTIPSTSNGNKTQIETSLIHLYNVPGCGLSTSMVCPPIVKPKWARQLEYKKNSPSRLTSV